MYQISPTMPNLAGKRTNVHLYPHVFAFWTLMSKVTTDRTCKSITVFAAFKKLLSGWQISPVDYIFI